MFTERIIEIAGRKAALAVRCAGDRASIAAACRRWEGPARHVDRAVVALRTLRAHPALLGAALLFAGMLGRRRLVRWASRGLFAWRAWRSLTGWMHRVKG